MMLARFFIKDGDDEGSDDGLFVWAVVRVAVRFRVLEWMKVLMMAACFISKTAMMKVRMTACSFGRWFRWRFDFSIDEGSHDGGVFYQRWRGSCEFNRVVGAEAKSREAG